MAIAKPEQTLQYKLQEETASRVLLLSREVTDKGDGSEPEVRFYATSHPKSITYEINDEGKRCGIYEEKDLVAVDLPFEKLMVFFMIPVTLYDGTKTTVGELISSFTDGFLAEAIGLNEGDTITTQVFTPANLFPPDPTPVTDPAQITPDPIPVTDPAQITPDPIPVTDPAQITPDPTTQA